jgi:hypothetical protein
MKESQSSDRGLALRKAARMKVDSSKAKEIRFFL